MSEPDPAAAEPVDRVALARALVALFAARADADELECTRMETVCALFEQVTAKPRRKRREQ